MWCGDQTRGCEAVFGLREAGILFFANNPFWRMETSGSYMLLFNAAINYKHLSARKAQAAPTGEQSGR